MEHQEDTKKILHMFHIDLKPKSNDKDIYKIDSFLDAK